MNVFTFCADDVHGTAVMLNAQAAGQTPLDYAAEITKAHIRDFQAFQISHDCYDTTHSDDNAQLSAEIYSRLLASGNIEKAAVEQLFDTEKGLFLADRFVRCRRMSLRAKPLTSMVTTVMPAVRPMPRQI